MPKRFYLFLIPYLIGGIINAQPNWPLIKSNTTLNVAIPSEFGTPVKQPLSVDGWEDGIFISRDGLNLYCLYLPIDALSWAFAGYPCVFTPYQKGPTFGMDLTTSPTTACPVWMQADVLISSRTTTSIAFPSWSLSNLSGAITSEGAPQITMLNATVSDIVAYTSNQLPPYSLDIFILRNSTINPPNTGTVLPSPVTQTSIEDNPHIERLSPTDLVLFFDSPDRLGGVGGLDMWYSLSNDDGITWTVPTQVSSINTIANEHQPHLYKDNLNQWWLYFATPDGSGKYAIYRVKQTIPNNWDSWGAKQLVLGPGNSASVGEPTLTQNGDLSFVVVYSDSINGTPTDKYDADPWFLPKLTTTNIEETNGSKSINLTVYPNPSSGIFLYSVNNNSLAKSISVYNIMGEEVFSQNTHDISGVINLQNCENGLYFIIIRLNNGDHMTRKIKKQ